MRFIPCHWLLCLHQTFACNVTSHVSCICGGWRVLILFVALRKETTNVCWILLCVDKYDIIRHPLNVINPQHHHHCPWLLSRQCFIKFMCHRSIDLSGFATIHKACLSPPPLSLLYFTIPSLYTWATSSSSTTCDWTVNKLSIFSACTPMSMRVVGTPLGEDRRTCKWMAPIYQH